jgi:signal transduction histidine kinase
MEQKKQAKSQSKGMSIGHAFSLFMMVSYLILGIVLLILVYEQISKSNDQQRDHFIDDRLSSLRVEFQGFIQSYQAALQDQTRFSIIRQTVMQPEQFQDIVGDFFDQLYLLGSQPQQVLVDFQGKIIYQKFQAPQFDYTQAVDVQRILTGQSERGFSVNFDASDNQFYWRMSVPVNYLGRVEGVLLAEIPFNRISDYLHLKSRMNDERINLKKGQRIVASFGKALKGEVATIYWDELDLTVEYIADTSEQLAQEKQLILLVLKVLLTALLGFALISIYLGRKYFVSPLVELTAGATKLADGDSRELPEVASSVKELQDLAKATTNMSKQLDKRTKVIEYAYEQLKANQKQLVQSEKMASLGLLSAGVAHEINNPAGFVKSNLEVLNDYQSKLHTAVLPYLTLSSVQQSTSGQFDESSLNALQQALTEVSNAGVNANEIEFIISDLGPLLEESLDGMQRIQQIVESMKKFARPDAEDKQMININEEIQNTVRLVWNELKYRCELKLNLTEIPAINGYPGKLNQVFMNMLINAAQAIEDKGLVTVSTSVSGSNVLIQFEDTGKGIPKEIIERVFEPFFSTKLQQKGTGLGLSISSDIIATHGGMIDVESEPDKGSRFDIYLPINDPEIS